MGVLEHCGKWVIPLGLTLALGAAQGQEIRLTGRVLEKAGLKPVPGARVVVAGRTDAAATTGADGRFSIVRAATGLRRSAFPASAQAVPPSEKRKLPTPGILF